MKFLSIPTLFLLLVLSGCQSSTPSPQGSTTASNQPGTQVQANTADKAFIDGMVPHHEMALMMADDALAKATHTELKTFATKVKEDQSREITQLKSYRQQWFGSDSTPMMDHSQNMTFPAGPNFDKEWAEEMIKHHQGAIEMAQEALTTASRPEIKQMAQAIIDAQAQEQTLLRGYIKAWN